MFRLAAPLSLAVVTVLGACAAPPPQQGGPAIPKQVVTNVHPYYPGTGVVQSVMFAPAMAAAGSTAEPMQRLEIKMDSGVVQYVDTTSRDFRRGTRVRLSEDRVLSRV